MSKVVLVVSTDHQDLLLPSDFLQPPVAQEWLKKIDTALGSAASTIETD
jgi:hypothetical protein